MKKIFLAFLLLIMSTVASADITMDELGALKGYTVLGVYQITGWHDTDGKKGDSYEGCIYGRVLILNYQFAITCTGYWYEYAFQPKVVVLSSGNSLKMVVNGHVRDVQ